MKDPFSSILGWLPALGNVNSSLSFSSVKSSVSSVGGLMCKKILDKDLKGFEKLQTLGTVPEVNNHKTNLYILEPMN